MSDSSSDDEALPNWDALSGDLGCAALAALKEHFASKDTGDGEGHTPPLTVPPVAWAAGPVEVTSNLDYKQQTYWEQRFAVEDEYEWLASFKQAEPHLSAVLPDKTARLLVVGCGNSSFSEELFDAGWVNVTSIDFSAVVIDRMRAKNMEARPCMKWEVMDMRSLEGFGDGSFDCVVDKAAMDALMCDEGSPWDPSEGTKRDAHLMCLACARVLVPGGRLVMISFAQPHFRRRYLEGFAAPAEVAAADGVVEAYGWRVTAAKGFGEPGCLETFLYACTVCDAVDPKGVGAAAEGSSEGSCAPSGGSD